MDRRQTNVFLVVLFQVPVGFIDTDSFLFFFLWSLHVAFKIISSSIYFLLRIVPKLCSVLNLKSFWNLQSPAELEFF